MLNERGNGNLPLRVYYRGDVIRCAPGLVIDGVLQGSLPWAFVVVGALIAAVVIFPTFKPGDLLTGLGIPVLLDQPLVGQNLQDHAVLRWAFRARAGTLLAAPDQTHWIGRRETYRSGCSMRLRSMCSCAATGSA